MGQLNALKSLYLNFLSLQALPAIKIFIITEALSAKDKPDFFSLSHHAREAILEHLDDFEEIIHL
jgi:hypothetical protein